MDRIDTENKDMIDVIKEITDKINEIIDWINQQ